MIQRIIPHTSTTTIAGHVGVITAMPLPHVESIIYEFHPDDPRRPVSSVVLKTGKWFLDDLVAAVLASERWARPC